VVAFFSLSLAAQETVPHAYLHKLAMFDRLQKVSTTDLAAMTSRAQSGAPDAQYQLALLYGAGRVLPEDAAAAERWMRKSAGQGYVPAETGMGEMYLRNRGTGDPKGADAEHWLLLAATKGDAEAQLWLGLGYDRGLLWPH
jgi:TPR repeat protein